MHKDCENIIKEVWKDKVYGCPMFILSAKLKTLKERLKTWNRNTFGNVQNYVSIAERTLKEIQSEI